eukprot:SAG11_NODE_4376_length_1925_cov_2.550931_3_plen_83_part_00
MRSLFSMIQNSKMCACTGTRTPVLYLYMHGFITGFCKEARGFMYPERWYYPYLLHYLPIRFPRLSVTLLLRVTITLNVCLLS